MASNNNKGPPNSLSAESLEALAGEIVQHAHERHGDLVLSEAARKAVANKFARSPRTIQRYWTRLRANHAETGQWTLTASPTSPNKEKNSNRRRHLFYENEVLEAAFDDNNDDSDHRTSMPKRSRKTFYAVAAGRTTGIYGTWADCQAQVDGFSNARFKGFRTYAEAQAFLESNNNNNNNEPAAAAVPTTTTTAVASADAPCSSAGHANSSSSSSRAANGKRAAAATTTTTTTTTQQSSSASSVVVAPAAKRARPSSPACGASAAASGGVVTNIAIAFDGGARGNPGAAGAGATVTINSSSYGGGSSRRKVVHIREYVGDCGTNNEAEYQGVVAALRVAQQEARALLNETPGGGAAAAPPVAPQLSLIVQGDSQLVLQQLRGAYEVRSDRLKGRYQQAMDLLQSFSQRENCQVSLEHVYRSDNQAADALANQAMDARRSWITTSEDNHEEQIPLDSYSPKMRVVHI